MQIRQIAAGRNATAIAFLLATVVAGSLAAGPASNAPASQGAQAGSPSRDPLAGLPPPASHRDRFSVFRWCFLLAPEPGTELSNQT